LLASLANAGNLVLSDLREAVAQADIIVFLVNHRAFSEIEPGHLEGKIVVNACGWRR
jgi:UDP-N-acetyl-D-mannosaminuronate dehydrogenase